MKKYLLHGKLSAKPGESEKLSDVLLRASEAVSQVKGCKLYAISNDPADPDSIWITEIWDSKEDHDNSLKLEATKTLVMQAMPLINGQPRKGQELVVLGGLGT